MNAAGHMDARREQGGNLRLVARRRYIADSRVVERMGAVVGRPQGTETVNHQQCQRLWVRPVRSKDAFSLMAGRQKPDYKMPSCSCDGAHKGIGDGNGERIANGEVPATTGGLQGLLHTFQPR